MKNQTKRILSRVCATIFGVFTIASTPLGAAESVEAASNGYELVDKMQDASILHCWNWSYQTIEENLELIAQCGYSAVQTSPATQPKDYTYEGVVGMEVGVPGEGSSGNWWKLYQPVAECVCDNGQTWLGTKDELKSLCAEAEKYGIKVIVDVVANHLGNIKGWQNSLDDVTPQVGTYWNPEMLTDESYWHINDYQTWMSDSRLHFTQGTMGMPDLNTADKRVQKYISDYLVELIDCGVDGFRFDAAKHIETPDDDPAFASDFWPTVLGIAESHYAEKTGKDLYVYGEILNTVGDNFSINSYTKYMSVTDNSAGNHLLESYRNNNVNTLSMDYANDVSVLWAESHDTYMNESSRYASDKSIVRTWAMVGNKDNAASLFFVRPYYSEDILENNQDGAFKSNLINTLTQATMGECETYVWASNEVAAINHFNNRMVNYSDNMGTDGNVVYCVRGQGIILVNFNGAGSISMSSHGLADGEYTDEVSGNKFVVSGGTISGTIESEYGIAVIYRNVMPNPDIDYPVQLSSSVANGTVFYTDSLEVEISESYADSASYKVSTGESGTFSGTKTLNLGADLEVGETVTLELTGTNTRGTKTESYTYTKDEYDLTDCIFFKNTNNWSTVTAYLWNDESGEAVTNSGWPGEKMFECDSEENIYALKIDTEAGYTKIIFSNNGSSQTADLVIGEVGELYNPSTNSWTQYKENDTTKTPTIQASVETSVVTGATEVTYTVKNAESATYQINDSEAVSFTDSVTVTVAEDLAEGSADTVLIKAVNGDKSKEASYVYTMDYKQPVVGASVETDTTFEESLEVTFTAENAAEASITINGETESFTDTITKTLTATSTVVISAVNGTKSAEATFNYNKYDASGNYVYFNVSACSWFGNDNAVLAAKFNGESSYTKCELVTDNGTSYYKAEVPIGASSVSICRVISNGNTYNELTVSLESGKNVWTGNSGFNGGSWSYNSAFGGGQIVEPDPDKKEMTVYFVNNYNWNGTIKAYYWGSDAETVSWPGVEMTSAGTDANGCSVYKITIPNDITGLIFTNGSAQTVDITTDLEDGKLFTINGNSGSKYSVSVSEY